MSHRLVARLIVVLALLVPIALGAQTFVQEKPKPKIPSSVSITLNPTDVAPARLRYGSGRRTFDAQGESVKMNYSATGLTVEMSEGSLAQTDSDGPWQSRGRDTFKTLHLSFATNGDMISIRISKD
jgi:hypothetical protein